MTPGLNFGIFTAASGPGKLTEFTRSRLHTRIYDIIQGTCKYVFYGKKLIWFRYRKLSLF